MTWDFFISHASEDKPLIAAPLAHYLDSVSFSTWYDDFCLNVGDSLTGAISKGLQNARYGIVTLSPDFFRKEWPMHELQALIDLERDRRTRILPVWHHITAAEISRFAPELADRKAADTKRGLQAVAEELVKASFPERADGLPLVSTRWSDQTSETQARQQLRSLLERNAGPEDLFTLLSAYPILIAEAFGYSPTVIPGYKLPGPVRCDFVNITPHGITGHVEITLLRLGPATYDFDTLRSSISEIEMQLGARRRAKRRPANDPRLPCVGQYESLDPLAQAIQRLVRCQNIHWDRPDTWCVRFMIIMGRRADTPIEERSKIRRSTKLPLEIASYDRWLDDRRSIYVEDDGRMPQDQ